MMKFTFCPDGMMTLTEGNRTLIAPSPVGMIVLEKELIKPIGASLSGDMLTLTFPTLSVKLKATFRKNGSLRLEVAEIPDEVEVFLFGTYRCPDAVAVGELVGAAWFEDGAGVCIQSLNSKTQDATMTQLYQNHTDVPSPGFYSASLSGKEGHLSCFAVNMTKPFVIPTVIEVNMKNCIAEPVEGEDGPIMGAAIVLTAAANDKEMIDDLCALELEEGLPHPTINGEWAKTSPLVKDPYLVFDGGDMKWQVDMAHRAGVNCIYYGDPFQSWGHFDINNKIYPGGKEEFIAKVKYATENGIDVGFHTLSNFIHTYDPYVTPIPDAELLAYDPTPLTADLSETDDIIPIADTLNYEGHQPLDIIRIGDELITFKSFSPETKTLCGCERGAFKTTAAPHKAGDTVSRLPVHSYRTVFPTIKGQAEMAKRIGRMIRECGIHRISFDGIEGCYYTGRMEYAAGDYVKRVFDEAGNELLCDASGGSNYRWHAHSYFNHGEPWYDHERLGGMYNYRARNMENTKLNLLPSMLGWYTLFKTKGRFEATTPEAFENIMARMIGFDAGCAICVHGDPCPRVEEAMDTIRLWREFSRTADIPEDILAQMRIETTNWHLEKKEDHWELREILIMKHDMGYNDNSSHCESGSTGYGTELDTQDAFDHRSIFVSDRTAPTSDMPEYDEPLRVRIRVGTKLNKGALTNLSFHAGWFGPEEYMRFDIQANAGEYLVYNGGTTITRYDSEFNPIETVQGVGHEMIAYHTFITGYTLHYRLHGDNNMQIMVNHYRTRILHKIPFKK